VRWVTRSFPAIDRTASAWLIKRFVDPDAEFVFIDWPEEELRPEHGIPFDIKGVELGHHGNRCTFETIVERYSIVDPYVKEIAKIVHAADIEGEIDKAPEARGLKLLFTGLRLVTKDDYETLEVGMKIWDAIYASLKLKEIEERYKDELEGLSKSKRLRKLKEILSMS